VTIWHILTKNIKYEFIFILECLELVLRNIIRVNLFKIEVEYNGNRGNGLINSSGSTTNSSYFLKGDVSSQ
jgi:hypothetical protein